MSSQLSWYSSATKYRCIWTYTIAHRLLFGKGQDKALFAQLAGHGHDINSISFGFNRCTVTTSSRVDTEALVKLCSARLHVATFGKVVLLGKNMEEPQCSWCRYVRSLAPNIHPPRWVVSLALNRFLDQDTYLLATQQSITLSNELRNIAEHEQHSSEQPQTASRSQDSDAQTTDRQQAGGDAGEGREGDAAAAPMARRSWYCHRSPTDNILVASGKWMDKAVPCMPNRYQAALTSSLQGMFGCTILAVCLESNCHAVLT